MTITVSAPAKIHLLGEHAVVYGKPALLASIDKRIYVRIKNKESRIKNNIIIDSSYGDKLIKESIKVFQRAFSMDRIPPIEIEVTSQIPVGSGLGSSAAVAAATIGALMKSVKNIWNQVRINELTYEVEKIAHGNPSGADNTTVIMGGLVWYRREFDFLKSIWSLPVSSYKIPLFFLIDSGRPEESTKEMVGHVAKLYSRNKNKMEGLLNDQEFRTKKLLLALRSGNMSDMEDAIKSGERNLEKMQVVGDQTKKIIREVEKSGGAAKICGAGGRKKGSGIILCYHPQKEMIPKVAGKYKLPLYPVALGGEGIRLEN